MLWRRRGLFFVCTSYDTAFIRRLQAYIATTLCYFYVSCMIIGMSYKRRARGAAMPTMAAVKIDGAKLKSLREQRFLTREELAEKVGSHRDHVGRLERGEVANPRMATIRNLAEALGVDPAELVE